MRFIYEKLVFDIVDVAMINKHRGRRLIEAAFDSDSLNQDSKCKFRLRIVNGPKMEVTMKLYEFAPTRSIRVR